MFKNCIDSSSQGNIGLGHAIGYFTANLYTVSIPLNDTQSYDLIIEKNNKLYTVQVKTTKYKRNKHFIVNLKECVVRRTYQRIKNADTINYDYLYVLCENNDAYLIPKNEIKSVKTQLTLNYNYDKYKL